MSAKERIRVGIILADGYGNYYHVREEILKKSLISKSKARQILAAERQPTRIQGVGILNCPTLTPLQDPDDLSAGTVMCPW